MRLKSRGTVGLVLADAARLRHVLFVAIWGYRPFPA